MPTYYNDCKVFDPIRFTTSTDVSKFIVDTWYDEGLITQDLYTRLPGLPTLGTGRVDMSSGMSMNRPKVEIGIQINNIRALPISVYIVDNGPADLLLGGDFLKLLFEMGMEREIDAPKATIEPPSKREKKALALKLLSGSESMNLSDIETFVTALRAIHNCAIIIDRGMHQHSDWNIRDSENAKRKAVERTVLRDAYLSEDDRLQLRWIESGSLWMTIRSGAKSGMSWLSQLFQLSMDAKLEKTIAEATSAKEKAKIAELSRDEIARARRAEAQLRTAKAVRQAKEEWRKALLEEIDFKKTLCNRIQDETVKDAVNGHLEMAVKELAESNLYAMIEHSPDDPEIDEHTLPKRHDSKMKREWDDELK
jgi:hypothetical protein